MKKSLDRAGYWETRAIRLLPSRPHGYVSLSILGNRFAASSLSKYYFYILDHFEYIIPCSIERFGPVVCLAFKMLAFLSYWVVHRKKPTVAKVHSQGLHNNVCMHYIPCLTGLKDYSELVNH